MSDTRALTLLASSRVQIAIAAVGLVLGVGGALLLATSEFLVDGVAYGLQTGIMVIGAVAAGLVWLRRRPGNPTGVLALALALATAPIALQGSNNEYLHSLGVLVEPVFFLLTYVIVFAFPVGRLTGRAERLILAAMTLYFMVGFVPWIFFSPVAPGGGPLAGCDPCPPNGLMIADNPTLAASFGPDLAWAVIVILTATIALLVIRLVTASRPRRRTLLPVYVPALILTMPILGFHGFAAGVLHLDADTLSDAGWTVVIGRCLLPFGFLLAIAQASLFAGEALKRLVGQIGGRPNASRLREIVAGALDDSSVELVFRLDGSAVFVDSRGQPAASAAAPDRRATSRVDRDGETVAAIWHDPALNTDPELVRAACQALLLALDLQTTTAELAASRARTVAAGDAERRRVQRDLHDGAQQTLVALQIKLALARELVADSALAAQLADVEIGLDDAVRELRDLARGVHPPVLRDFGLRAALVSAMKRSTPPAELITDDVSRYPPDVETAVYFCCLESLQNAAKHAGADARVQVNVAERAGELHFEVIDDGVGCELGRRHAHGSGLTNMTDRVAALNGSLTVDSAAGRGTQVRGRIPLASRRPGP